MVIKSPKSFPDNCVQCKVQTFTLSGFFIFRQSMKLHSQVINLGDSVLCQPCDKIFVLECIKKPESLEIMNNMCIKEIKTQISHR